MMYIILGILLIILFCLIGSKEGFKAKRPWIKCADEVGYAKPHGALLLDMARMGDTRGGTAP